VGIRDKAKAAELEEAKMWAFYSYQKGLADGVAMRREMEKADTRPEWVQNLDGTLKRPCSLCMTPANTRIRDGERDVYFCEKCAEIAVVSMPATPEALKAIHRRMAELGSAAREARRKRGLSW
jgi:hypothetical protein